MPLSFDAKARWIVLITIVGIIWTIIWMSKLVTWLLGFF
jgi:hypothetical protein